MEPDTLNVSSENERSDPPLIIIETAATSSPNSSPKTRNYSNEAVVPRDEFQQLLIIDQSSSDDPTCGLIACSDTDERRTLDLRNGSTENADQLCNERTRKSSEADPTTPRSDDNGCPATNSERAVHWNIKNRDELLSMSIPALNCLLEKLHLEVEEVSSVLVLSLQERHRLQDEVDIRFIAIEQLLKVPGKLLCRSSEPLPATVTQLREALPQTEADALQCQ